MSLTFVSAFIDIYEDRSNVKTIQTCIEHFRRLVSSGISIHVFLNESFYTTYKSILPHSPNIYFELINYTDLQTYKDLEGLTYNLPAIRAPHKDTDKFMIIMNAKIDFIYRAMNTNVFGTSHFAWIDFSIGHVLKNWNSSCKYLQLLSSSALQDKCLIFPGCWSKRSYESELFLKINWRFCGGFFIGDRISLMEMYTLYRQHFRNMVMFHGILPWETNVWHYLELNYDWAPHWFSSNHDDSIIRVPFYYFKTVASLTTIPSRVEHECRKTLDSLIGQVDKIYLSIADVYKHFGEYKELPAFLQEEPYKSAVQVVRGIDFGPATKYLGPLAEIPDNSWIFFCDDNHEYTYGLIERMTRVIDSVAIYQNHYSNILQKTSGGIIHGYAGNFIHKSLLHNLPSFPFPPCAYFVDDQWISIYCHKEGLQIHATNIEAYSDIFKVLDNHHEKWGGNSLSGLHNRDQKVKELCDWFNVRFCHEEGLPYLLTNAS